ncbi:MAG: uroporphyrinogen-III C-methyltransferase [Gemmatimonadaceae bacterium]|nr:uroporphyrinogen-III C-methyltransferase [Gloeobacterales cyanobacterium ES-bin-141]
MTGKVYLVGSGPGGIDYLTVRARRVIETAEVLLYDDLVDREILGLATGIESIDVGKRAGAASFDQSQICRLLVEHCRAGRQVVRLKSGDPLIFGRALSELEALKEAGCPFEVVPGISTALGAPLFAGIPLTEAHLSQCFAVLSGHDLLTLPWPQLSRIDTLVVLMGTRNLGQIAERLMDCGRPPSMPVAVVCRAGRPQQRTVFGTLETIAEQMQACPNPTPAVIVVGPVVRHGERLNWFENRPLSGRTILVTRSAEQASDFSHLLTSQGAGVLEMPALVVSAPSSWDALDRAISRIGAYRWLILTSTNGVEAFFARLHHHHLDLRALGGVRVAVVGPKTARVAADRGLVADFIPGSYDAEGMLAEFPDRNGLAGAQVLFVRVEAGGREAITRQLQTWGALVDEVAGYATVCPERADPSALLALRTGQIDCVTFASSKTVRHFVSLVQSDLRFLEGVRIASIGPQTSQTCREHFGRVDIEAASYTLAGLGEAIVTYFDQKTHYV